MSRRFSLEAVLRFREQRELTEERALLALNAELQQVRTALMRMEQETARFRTVRDQLMQQVISAAHHLMLASQWRSLQDAHQQLKSRLQALSANRDEQQNRLMSARSDRQMLSDLRDQHRRTVAADEELRERKQIDDLFSSRRLQGASTAFNKTFSDFDRET